MNPWMCATRADNVKGEYEMTNTISRNGSIWARVIAIAVFAVLVPAAAATPAFAQNVAKVNIREVAEKHPVYVQWVTDTEEMRTQRQAKLDTDIRSKFNLPENPEEANLTQEQQLEIQQYLYQENQRFIEEMEPSRVQKLLEVENDIIAKVESIAKSNGYTLVLDSSVVLVGGTDITAQVVSAVGGASGE